MNKNKLSKNNKIAIGVLVVALIFLVILVRKKTATINPLKDITAVKVDKEADWDGNTHYTYSFSEENTDKINRTIMEAIVRKKYPKAKNVIPKLSSSSSSSSTGFFEGLGNTMNDYSTLYKALGSKDASQFLADVTTVSTSLKFKKEGSNQVKAYFDISKKTAQEDGINPAGKVFDIKSE